MVRESWRWTLIVSVMLTQGCTDFQHPVAQSTGEQASAPSPPSLSEMQGLLNSGNLAELDRRFSAVQRAYEKGVVTDEDLRAAFRVFYPTAAALAPRYDAWVSAYPQSYVAHLARGIYYTKVGEDSRGGDTLSNTSAEQLQGMERAFQKASADFDASMELDTRPLLTYLHAMSIALYEGEGAQTRGLLDLAIKADPGNFIVREKYIGTLEPRWGGSTEQMYAFLEESRKAGLSSAHLARLKAVILADEAQTHWLAKEYAEAERDYRAAISLGDTECLSCLASVLIEDRKDEQAIPVLSQILGENPGDIRSLQLRAHAYWRLGKMREANADFTTAADQGDPFAATDLGRFNMSGVPGVLAANPELAVSWFRKSAAQGNLAGSMELEKALKQVGTGAPNK